MNLDNEVIDVETPYGDKNQDFHRRLPALSSNISTISFNYART